MFQLSPAGGGGKSEIIRLLGGECQLVLKHALFVRTVYHTCQEDRWTVRTRQKVPLNSVFSPASGGEKTQEKSVEFVFSAPLGAKKQRVTESLRFSLMSLVEVGKTKDRLPSENSINGLRWVLFNFTGGVEGVDV